MINNASMAMTIEHDVVFFFVVDIVLLPHGVEIIIIMESTRIVPPPQYRVDVK